MFDVKRLRLKTFIFTLVAVLTNVFGNLALSQGMHQVGLPPPSPVAYLGVLLNLWVVAGVSLLFVWMISQLSLLSWADLSYVLPVTASSYVLTALAGNVFLHEDVPATHWAGIVLISLGVAVVGRTSPRTAAEPGVAE